MNKVVSPSALVSLKEALSKIYWYKKDLRSFLDFSIKNNTIVSTIDWPESTKYEAVSQLIDRMSQRQDIYLDDLLKLINDVCNFNDFDHFDRLEDKDGKKLKADAKASVSALRKNCTGYFEGLEAEKQAKTQKERFAAHQQHTQDYNRKLSEFKDRYYNLAKLSNLQKRGYEFESFLNELFLFFDLSPRSSFKITGEQIDGAFTHDNNDYLLEAKWQNAPIERGEIDIFEAKISRKLKTTLGLFIAVNGFVDVVSANAGQYKSTILMDSQDLVQVLEKRISLQEIILLKRRHAAETGEIMYRVNA